MTLTENQTKELRQLFESVVDDRFSTLSKQVSALNAKVSTLANSVNAVPQNDITNLRADVLELAKRQDDIRSMLNVGRASMNTNSNEIHLSDEDKQKFLPAKLAEFDLGDVVKMSALADGIDVNNDREFDHWLGVDKIEAKRATRA
jgi:hypothetical protein